VEQGGGDGDVVEAQLGDDHGDRERVLDVRLTGVADLPGVRVGGLGEGAADHRRRAFGWRRR
jgi:hypothetical protein